MSDLRDPLHSSDKKSILSTVDLSKATIGGDLIIANANFSNSADRYAISGIYVLSKGSIIITGIAATGVNLSQSKADDQFVLVNDLHLWNSRFQLCSKSIFYKGWGHLTFKSH